MTAYTGKQKRSQQHNWLRLRLAGCRQHLVAITTADTATKEAQSQANGIIDLIEELNEMLKVRLDDHGNVEHVSD